MKVMETVILKTCGWSGCHDEVKDINLRSGHLYYYCAVHREGRKLAKKKQYANFKEKYIEYGKKSWNKIKTAFLEKYGGECECCGEMSPEFLSLDHIHGGGKQDRKTKGNWQVYRDAIDNYQPDKYQVLCHNCNFAMGIYHQCPHNKKVQYDRKEICYTKYSTSENNVRRFHNLRVSFFEMYGDACVNCNQRNRAFLSLDHILNNGRAHRRERGLYGIYKDATVRRDNSHYQILCYNCNFSKSRGSSELTKLEK